MVSNQFNKFSLSRTSIFDYLITSLLPTLTCTMEHHSGTKKEQIVSFAEKQTELETMILHEMG